MKNNNNWFKTKTCRYIKIFFLILAALFGLFLIVFGGYDDSPGAQGLGLLFVIASIIIIIKIKNKIYGKQ